MKTYDHYGYRRFILYRGWSPTKAEGLVSGDVAAWKVW
jgi:hypothetical protein